MALITINNNQYELPDVGVLRYLKDPVSTINNLYVEYPDGGEYGWFALCTDTNRFAVWSIIERQWVDTGLSAIDISEFEESTAALKSNDYILAYLPDTNKTVKVKVSKLPSGGGTPETDLYKSNVTIINTEDFIPVKPAYVTGHEYQFTPGSYGVVFDTPPISGLSDTNFNLKVDYSSHDGSGADGDQDFIHTLTSNSGRVFTRRVYKNNDGSQNYTSTTFVEIGLSEVIIDGISYSHYNGQSVEF